MEEIKVNDYIRTPYDTIEKIIKVEENKDYIGVKTDRSYYIFSWLKTHEVKHSSNIKDLIQAGDIVIYTINCKIADIDIVKEQKILEELKEKNMHITKETVDFINSHYIHKDRIKAKIEEIEKRRLQDGECELALHEFQREAKLEVLQSLLKEEE